MIPTVASYLECLKALHAELRGTIESLPTEALDWVPGRDMNSICVIVVHLAGAERSLVGALVGGDPVKRDRDAEFQSRNLSAATLCARLDETLAHSQGVLDRLTMSDLDAERILPRDGRKTTVAWCLYHALDHAGVHLGQIQITKQLWDQRAA